MSWSRIGTENRALILQELDRAGLHGCGTMELMRKLRLGESSVGGHLRALLAANAVAKVPLTGRSARWYLAGLEPPMPAKRKRKRRGEQIAQWLAQWPEQTPVRRIVPAATAKPLKTNGVRSVWELA